MSQRLLSDRNQNVSLFLTYMPSMTPPLRSNPKEIGNAGPETANPIRQLRQSFSDLTLHWPAPTFYHLYAEANST